MQVLPIDDASAPVFKIRENHKVVCTYSMPLSPLPRAGGFIEYVDLGDLHSMRMPNGSEKTYCLSVIIKEVESLEYSIKVRPRCSICYHPRVDQYSNYEDAYLDMWMHKTLKRQFETHCAHWSVKAIHVVPSASCTQHQLEPQEHKGSCFTAYNVLCQLYQFLRFSRICQSLVE